MKHESLLFHVRFSNWEDALRRDLVRWGTECRHYNANQINDARQPAHQQNGLPSGCVESIWLGMNWTVLRSAMTECCGCIRKWQSITREWLGCITRNQTFSVSPADDLRVNCYMARHRCNAQKAFWTAALKSSRGVQGSQGDISYIILSGYGQRFPLFAIAAGICLKFPGQDDSPEQYTEVY